MRCALLSLIVLVVTVGAASAQTSIAGTQQLPTGCATGDVATYSTVTRRWSCSSTVGSSAPVGATYLTQTADGTLSAEQALSALASGIMRVATTTGAVTALTDSSGLFANLSDETGGSGVVVGSASPALSGAVGLTQGTIATDIPYLNITSTWNAAGVTFRGILANVTCTACATASLLIDLQKAGVSQFKVSHDGNVTAPGHITALGYVRSGLAAGFEVPTRSILRSSANGLFEMTEGDLGGFGRLNFGGVTEAFNGITNTDAVASKGNGIIVQQADGTPAVFTDLGAATNGAIIYCSDCTNDANPCTGSGTGAYAKRLNGAWVCS